MNDKILPLRISYWAGAILDVLAFLLMSFPVLFAWNNQLTGFQPGLDFRYAMGMGAPLMLGWTVLLLWADRRPVERRQVLLITLLVVAGEAATELYGVLTGFLTAAAVVPTWIIQALLAGLFVYAYRISAQDSG